jgi:hypothetical protein
VFEKDPERHEAVSPRQRIRALNLHLNERLVQFGLMPKSRRVMSVRNFHTPMKTGFDAQRKAWFRRKMTLEQWVLLAMAKAWAFDVHGVLQEKFLPGSTPSDIAASIATANAEKPLFAGEEGPRMGASLMTSLGRFETGFRQVAGDCKDKPPGWPGCGKEGTHPTSFCFLQIHFEDGQEKVEGYTREELMTDPLKCARAGREIIRQSLKESPADFPLLRYAGTKAAAKVRFDVAKRLFHEVPF